ncbi:MAG: CsiV family protein [Pseudomonadota bacterium]
MKLRILIAIVLPLLAIAQAWAQEEQDSWYDVEVILFAKGADGSQELTTEFAPPAELNEAVALSAAPGATTPTLLQQSQLRLAREADRIAKRRNYKLLAHFGWRQQGLDAASAPSILIYPYDKLPGNTGEAASTETPTADLPSLLRRHQIYGTAKFIKSRYLHIDVDLMLNMPTAASTAENTPAADAPALIKAFRLKESRRMRSQEIHYLDHPRFGMIVTARPLKPAAKAGQ